MYKNFLKIDLTKLSVVGTSDTVSDLPVGSSDAGEELPTVNRTSGLQLRNLTTIAYTGILKESKASNYNKEAV